MSEISPKISRRVLLGGALGMFVTGCANKVEKTVRRMIGETKEFEAAKAAAETKEAEKYKVTDKVGVSRVKEINYRQQQRELEAKLKEANVEAKVVIGLVPCRWHLVVKDRVNIRTLPETNAKKMGTFSEDNPTPVVLAEVITKEAGKEYRWIVFDCNDLLHRDVNVQPQIEKFAFACWQEGKEVYMKPILPE